MQQQQRKQTFQEVAYDYWYNLRFIIMSYFHSLDKEAKSVHQIFILGHRLELDEQNLEEQINNLKDIVSRTLWMSYRKNYPALLGLKVNYNLGTTYISDTGWGCMVRVGQMAMAQFIKKHLKNFGDRRDQDLSNIAQAFVDNDQGEVNALENYYKQVEANKLKSQQQQSRQYFLSPFSIQKIALVAQRECGLLPGDWYKPNQILFTLEFLHNNFPIKGSEDLRLLIFNDSSLFLDQILKRMYGENTHKTIADLEKSEGVQANGVAFCVLSRLGLEEVNANYLATLDLMMELPYFQGIVGGTPQRALYMLGKLADKYIYLDPHYVQEATSKESVALDLTSFYCSQMMLIDKQKIDPSMGICFYVRDGPELLAFWKSINEIKQKQTLENFFIYVADQTPDYMINEDYCEIQDEDIMIIP